MGRMRECGIGVLDKLPPYLHRRYVGPLTRAGAAAPVKVLEARGKENFPGDAALFERRAGGKLASTSEASDSDQEGASRRRRRRYNVIFLGDSLVTGVGCSSADGPAFPRAVAQRLAQHMGADVNWQCYGLTGGDTRMLEQNVVDRIALSSGRTVMTAAAEVSVPSPAEVPSAPVWAAGVRALLREGRSGSGAHAAAASAAAPPAVGPSVAVAESSDGLRTLAFAASPCEREMLATPRRDEPAGPPYDEEVTAVVLLVGLNEWKQVWRGAKTPWTFRGDLEDLLRRVRQRVAHVNPDGALKIFLPALPVHWAPGLADIFPLSLFVPFIAGLWDHQKRLVGAVGVAGGQAAAAQNVFVGLPSQQDVTAAIGSRPNDPALWAEDGVHPSTLGYRAWGRFLADAMFAHMGSGCANAGSDA